MRNDLNFFAPYPPYKRYGDVYSSGRANASLKALFWIIGISVLMFCTGFILSWDSTGEVFVGPHPMMYYAPLTAVVGVITHFVGTRTNRVWKLSKYQHYALVMFEKMSPENQAALGGRESFITDLKHISESEALTLIAKINGIISNEEAQAELIRSSITQYPRILESLDSIANVQQQTTRELKNLL